MAKCFTVISSTAVIYIWFTLIWTKGQIFNFFFLAGILAFRNGDSRK